MSLLLSETELKQCLTIDHRAIDFSRRAFSMQRQSKSHSPLPNNVAVVDSDASLELRAGLVEDFPWMTVRTVAHWHRRHSASASANSTTQLINCKTGQLDALLTDTGYFRGIRAAVNSAVATELFAQKNIDRFTIIGNGQQLPLQVAATLAVRQPKQLIVWGRDLAKVQQQIQPLQLQFPMLKISAQSDLKTAISAAQLLITITATQNPLILADCFSKGLHINAIGADSENKNEFTAAAMDQVDRVFVDHVSLCERTGELRHARLAGRWMETPVEIGQVIDGSRRGRRDHAEVTLCDLCGTTAQDTAMANLAMQNALQMQLGRTL